MALLIDSSVLIAAERGVVDLGQLFGQEETILLPAIAAAELLHGVHRATGQRQKAREAFVERLLASLPVLPFDLFTARVHARLWAELAARGISVGAHDLLIAASAVANDATVATRDLRSFPRIPGVKVVQW